MKKAPYYLYENNRTEKGFCISKVDRLEDIFAKNLLTRWDIYQLGTVFKEKHAEKDYINGKMIKVGNYTKAYRFVIKDNNCNSVSQNELYEAFNNFESERKERHIIEGLFGVPDVERGYPIEGTGQKDRIYKKRMMRKVQNTCLNEIKQVCKQYHDLDEPKVRNKRNFYNDPFWSGYYTEGVVLERNWKKYRNKQYK